MELVRKQSDTLRRLEEQGRIAIVGGMYDIASGRIEFFTSDGEPAEDGPREDGLPGATPLGSTQS